LLFLFSEIRRSDDPALPADNPQKFGRALKAVEVGDLPQDLLRLRLDATGFQAVLSGGEIDARRGAELSQSLAAETATASSACPGTQLVNAEI
jgi:hypothetical protein